MKAKIITPLHYIKPKCQAIVKNEHEIWQCHNRASIHINGKDVCRKHAACIALNHLLEVNNG